MAVLRPDEAAQILSIFLVGSRKSARELEKSKQLLVKRPEIKEMLISLVVLWLRS